MRNIKQFDFSLTPTMNKPRASFNRSFNFKGTMNAGYLVPCFSKHVNPGDTMILNGTFFARELTLLFPSMDSAYFECFFFYVPLRLLQDNFVKIMGERRNPSDSIDFAAPIFDITKAPLSVGGGGFTKHSLADYFGHPTLKEGLIVNTYKYRAYNKVYNDWGRRPDLMDAVPENVDDGLDDPADYVLLKSVKRPDYFTSCTPQPQKGDPVTMPLGTSAPVVRKSNAPASTLYIQGTNGTFNSQYLRTTATGILCNDPVDASAMLDNTSGIEVDLSSALAPTVNQIREAAMIQQILELDVRTGPRYNELVYAHFGVEVPDFRVQRSEFLGSFETELNHHVVPQTSSTSGSNLQANLAAFGTVLGNGGFKKSFVEHGIVLGVCRIRASVSYQQGLEREDVMRTRYDFPDPLLAHLGEQPVTNGEIYYQGSRVLDGAEIIDDQVFGYIPRFDDRRYSKNIVCGEFRSNDSASLDAWHYCEEFGSLPLLNDSFMEDKSDIVIDRTIAVTGDVSQFKVEIAWKLNHIQCLPTFARPGIHIL